MPTSGNLLQTIDLVKRYGPRTVVDRVSYNVGHGEIVGLLGRNGAGKTTSFRITIGMITPNAQPRPNRPHAVGGMRNARPRAVSVGSC